MIKKSGKKWNIIRINFESIKRKEKQDFEFWIVLKLN